MQAGDGKVFRFDTPAEARAFEAAPGDAGGSVIRLEPPPRRRRGPFGLCRVTLALHGCEKRLNVVNEMIVPVKSGLSWREIAKRGVPQSSARRALKGVPKVSPPTRTTARAK